VDVHQPLADPAKQVDGDGLAVDAGDGAAIGMQVAREDQRRVVVLDARFVQQRGERDILISTRKVEDRLNARPLLAGTEHVRRGAPTDNRAQCVDDDRLPRARLARERVHARLEGDA
jgi:hypothetical protein